MACCSFGRKCLQDSGLASREARTDRARASPRSISRETTRRTSSSSAANAFTDGNRLAYLALAIAIGMDSLILMAALFGASGGTVAAD